MREYNGRNGSAQYAGCFRVELDFLFLCFYGWLGFGDPRVRMGTLWSSGMSDVLDLRAQSKQCRERSKGSANVSGSQCPSVNVNSVTSAYIFKKICFVYYFVLREGVHGCHPPPVDVSATSIMWALGTKLDCLDGKYSEPSRWPCLHFRNEKTESWGMERESLGAELGQCSLRPESSA